MATPADILLQFDIPDAAYTCVPTGSGYINNTYKVSGPQTYILQRVNKNIFTRPDIIARNLRLASDYLRTHYPDYRFLSSIRSKSGQEMWEDEAGFPWRLFPYIEHSITIDEVRTEKEAFEAAAGFGRLSRLLWDCPMDGFAPTLERFHDLTWRFEQFQTALQHTADDRRTRAADAIAACLRYAYLVQDYQEAIASGILTPHLQHNDTKINNILFDAHTREVLCVIDLDTLMPGYFIYDFGDMVRTFVSPVNEEERDLDKVIFRDHIYAALREGYLREMGDKLTREAQALLPFASMMMTYIMALRMLADFLNGNIYYQIRYEEQNLVRARNQMKLMDEIRRHLCPAG